VATPAEHTAKDAYSGRRDVFFTNARSPSRDRRSYDKCGLIRVAPGHFAGGGLAAKDAIRRFHSHVPNLLTVRLCEELNRRVS